MAFTRSRAGRWYDVRHPEVEWRDVDFRVVILHRQFRGSATSRSAVASLASAQKSLWISTISLSVARVFILGAGASHFAGYPLGLDLWAFIRDVGTTERMARERAETVMDAIDEFFR